MIIMKEIGERFGDKYVSPEIEVIVISLQGPLLQSNLEDPGQGGNHGWADNP